MREGSGGGGVNVKLRKRFEKKSNELKHVLLEDELNERYSSVYCPVHYRNY